MPGKPVAQSRPRGRVQKGAKGMYVQFYEDRPSKEFKQQTSELLREQILETPVIGPDFLLPFTNVHAMIALRFNMPRPSGAPARVTQHTKKPDVDNLAKAVLDAIVMAKILADDNCVTDLTIAKRFVTVGHPEGIEIDLTVRPTEMY